MAWWMISAIIGFSTPSARADAPQSASTNTTIIYFTRHAEDVPELVGSDPSFTVTFNNCNGDGSCCEEVLNPLGKQRAAALASWFQEKGITRTLTHVIASPKVRTRQTVSRGSPNWLAWAATSMATGYRTAPTSIRRRATA